MILYYLKEAFSSLFKSKMATLLIIVTTAIAIIFVSLSAGILIFSKFINTKLQENISINLFVSDTVNTIQTARIEDLLKSNIYLKSFNYISKEQALVKMKTQVREDFLSVLEANPLPASFVVKLNPDSVSKTNINFVVDNFKKIPGIDEVVYDYDLTLKILDVVNSSKKIVYGLSLFLALLSIYLVYSNNRLLLTSRITQYNTMKLVGAKLSTIKIPILLNGILVGIIASLICIGLYLFALRFIEKVYINYQFLFEEYYLYAFLLLLGMILGFLGSWLSTLKVTLKISRIK